ncbi:MAG: hypothetical protein ACI4TK_01280 [Agathobacter sp.]
MSKTNKRISVAKFEKILNKDNIVYIPLEGLEDVSIEVTKTISLRDVVEFVENVAESCVDLESGEYTPQVRDFAIKKELLTRYANFTMPQNIGKQYEFIYNSNIVDTVIQNINQLQFQEIVASIDRKIKFMLDCITSIAASNTVKLLDKLETVAEQNSSMFDSLGGDDLAGVFKDISTIANMNEESIARAVHKTKMEDIPKDNKEE